MKSLLVFQVWRHPRPVLAAVSTMAVVFLWPSIPLGGVGNWLRFFYYYSPQNYLLSLMTVLCGLYVGLYVYNKTVAACCPMGNARTDAVGSLIGIVLGVCPACIPVLGFFLPLTVTMYLSYASWVFTVIAIAVLGFGISRFNGFKKVAMEEDGLLARERNVE